MQKYVVPAFHQSTPPSEIEQRIEQMQYCIGEQGLDAMLIVYGVDLLYYSGTMQAGYLLIPAEGPAVLMVRRELERAKAETSIGEVVALKRVRDLPNLVNEYLRKPPRRLGIELDVVPVNLFRRFQSLWPTTEFIDSAPTIMAQRSIKSDYEIAKMKDAGDLARRVYAQVPQLIETGMTEMDLAGKMTSAASAGGHQNYLRTRGFNQAMYSWHVISGESGGIVSSIDAPFSGYGLSPAFPMGASLKKIQSGEPVLIDFGICLDGYHVDLTRMFAIGQPPQIIRNAYEALIVIEKKLIENLLPGEPGNRLFVMAKKQADQLGFGDAFLGRPGLQVRFVGHGVGLEFSEPPFLAPGHKTPLQEGMTLALELKMVFSGLGAAGLENTLVIRETGPEKLTPADETFITV